MSWSWIWVLIPITALLVGAFTEWLKFKAKQQKIGSSTDELETKVETLQGQLATAERRIQNLEAIVTSQMWDVLHDDALPATEKERALAEARTGLALPDEEPDATKVERMARRLRL